MVHVQAIAELVDTSSDLLLVNGEIKATRHAMLYLVKLDAFLTSERTRRLVTLENDIQASRTHLHKEVSVSRHGIDGGARRTSPRLYTKEAMEATRDFS